MANMYRRIVTERNGDGRSFIAKNSDVGVAALGIVDFWKTASVPSSSTEDSDKTFNSTLLEPPKGGTCFRFFEIPPVDRSIPKEEADKKAAAEFARVGATHCRVDTARYPMMHTTSTIDYVVVLSGKVTLLLDLDEVELKPFDVVVQRATNHYWLNYGDKPALLMGVLLDAAVV